MTLIKLVSVIVVMVLVVGAPLTHAVRCVQVASGLQPCFGYLTSGAAVPAACCTAARNLKAAAKTTRYRQQVCRCLKRLARKYRTINYGLVGGLPGKCRISIPYKLSPSTVCSRIR